MPTLNEIQELILRKKGVAQDEVRREYLLKLSEYTKRDVILYATAFTSNKGPGIPSAALSIMPEDMQGFMASLHGLKNDKLDIILHSPGGSMEAADQIVQYLRTKYKHIRAIIPQNAMSAATMLACACDSIVMGKHSAIGPIDPQVTFPTANGAFTAPAQAILDEFERAKAEITQNQGAAALWINKFQSYPHGFLNLCQNTLRLSKEKVEEWLKLWMLKDDTNNNDNANTIASWLSNANEHKTHGRPINIISAKEKGMVIEKLEDDQDLQELVLSVYHAAMVTFMVTPCVKIVENHNGKGLYTQIEVKSVPVK